MSEVIKKPNPLIPGSRRQLRASALRERVVGVKVLTSLEDWGLKAAVKAETHVMGYGGHGDLA